MSLTLTGKHLDLTPAIQNFIETKLKKLDKWKSNLINPHIVLSKSPDGFVADAIITTEGKKLVASAKNSDMYNAISELITKLERQLDKWQHKDKAKRAENSIKSMNEQQEIKDE